MDATGQFWDGIHIESCLGKDSDGNCIPYGKSAVTLTNDYGIFNESHGNNGDGYWIKTGGAVTVTNVDSYQNWALAAEIDNSGAPWLLR